MNLVPVGNKIVVKRDLVETQTPGGIVLPDASKQKASRGKVLAVGPGKMVDGRRQLVDVREGQTVVFSSYIGPAKEVEVGTEIVVVLDEEDILGILQ